MRYFKLTSLSFVIASIPFFGYKCDKKASGECLQGKVIRITCATTVVQVINRNDIGTDGWKDGHQGANQTYDNVFSVSNKCSLPADLKVGDEFSFKIDKPKPSADCIVCMMYDAPPDAKYNVENLSKEPCK